MKEIILLGGGGHCKSVIDIIEELQEFKIVGIVDRKDLIGSEVLGYPVIASDEDIEKLALSYRYALVTVGQTKSPDIRIKLYSLAKKAGFEMPSIVSPRAYISKYSKIGDGTVVLHDSLINANSSIGNNCIVNSKALIEHDVKIQDHCHISTNSVVNGGATVCEGSFIGSGAVVVNSIIVKKNSFIKAGTVAS
jgi:sugar O-acyltransferase (sialic acid O-acetyltransferase NeuD family)|tara:strand:+ start:5338 stop:5916 length:579 start_codon:yes stop_codon:yes gene_type:complete